MGGLDRAPHTPRRSERPGQAAALLDTPRGSEEPARDLALNLFRGPRGMPSREVGDEPVAGQLPGLVGELEPLHTRDRAQGARDLGMHSLDLLHLRRG